MKKELQKRFNEEVHRYRNALMFCARKCDWETFRVKAGNLFDYLENIEMSVTERKFYRMFKIILAALCLVTVLILKFRPPQFPVADRIYELMIIGAVAGCCFEVYFFYNFRSYMRGKMIYYGKRKEKFIREIMSDFRQLTS
jgi:hypothetical protein